MFTTSSTVKQSLRVITEKNLPVAMRDGTVLRADIYRPDAVERFPVLLYRTPYDKASESSVELAQKLSERGYVVVMQDVRGRYASDGGFRPGFYSSDTCDSEDGYDTVEWAAGLPWSTGKVGTFGNSYNGWTQWELAHTRPPHLVAMLPQGCVANLLDRELSGVARLGRILSWTISFAADERRRDEEQWGAKTTDDATQLWMESERMKWLWYLPLAEIPDDAFYGMGEHWRRWLDHHATDHFGFESRHSQIDVPALMTTGWYDQQIWTIKNFTGMVKNGMTDHARDNQHLIIGPWSHTGTAWERVIGEVDFGPEAAQDYYDVADAWFSHWLKDAQNDVAEWPPIRLFVMGANVWRSENEWPLARTAYTDFYLHSNGHANTAAGDGLLTTTRPGAEPADVFTYDPRDPVMTLYTPLGQHEPQDQRVLNGREDVLVYSTPPLSEPIEVTGPIELTLWAASSATDTDFIIKLMDVWPSGFTQELCHGIVRARYRESFDEPSPIEPGEVYEYTIRLNPTSNLFQMGHQIRVDVSSSDFPNFDRNHNTGGDDYSESALIPATQTIYHDHLRPSRIVLPVIP